MMPVSAKPKSKNADELELNASQMVFCCPHCLKTGVDGPILRRTSWVSCQGVTEGWFCLECGFKASVLPSKLADEQGKSQ